MHYFNSPAFLGMTKEEIGTQLHTARQEVLAVDVLTIDNATTLQRFLDQGEQLLQAIRLLNSR